MEVINLRNVDGETRAMCRLFAIEGMNYLDIVIQENNQGAFEFIDAYSFTTGEMLSVTMRQLMMPIMATIWKTPVQKLFGGGDAYANAVANIWIENSGRRHRRGV
ncbi:hypothetical protein OAE25_02570 [Verrucomicrobiales bacterium]|nr:hypothetical protein [Verrucomicrobiales bacterium]